MAGRPTRKLNLHGEVRKCFTSTGKAKKKFTRPEDAWAFIHQRQMGTRVVPYECEFHGWHIGKNKKPRKRR